MSLTDTEIPVAELYKIVLGVATAYFTSHDKVIVYDGNTYQPIPIKRSNISYHSDLQVDQVEISAGLVGITLGTELLSIPKIVRRGYLRNAHVYIYVVDWSTNPATLLSTLFEGYVTGDILYDEGSISLSCGSLLDRLKEKLPKFIYSESCNHNLFDTYCGLVKDSYAHAGTATAGSTTAIIYGTVFAFSNHAEGYWEKGEIAMTSGTNIGISRSVKKHYDGYVTINIPFHSAVAVGNTFNAYPGCDGAGSTCESKFNNYANFLGFEYIPAPDVIYG